MSVPQPEDLLKLSKLTKCPDPECSGYMGWFWYDGKRKLLCDIEARHMGATKTEPTHRQRVDYLKATTPKPAQVAAAIITAALVVFVILLLLAGCLALIKGL